MSQTKEKRTLHTVDAIINTKIVNANKNLEEDEIVIPVPRALLERCKRTERKEREKRDLRDRPRE